MKFTEGFKQEIKNHFKNKTPKEIYEEMIEHGMVDSPMPTDNTYISVDLKEYKQLVEDSIILSALEGAGVDNWDWYDEAIGSIGDLQEEVKLYIDRRL